MHGSAVVNTAGTLLSDRIDTFEPDYDNPLTKLFATQTIKMRFYAVGSQIDIKGKAYGY
jgi:hypothetical protein